MAMSWSQKQARRSSIDPPVAALLPSEEVKPYLAAVEVDQAQARGLEQSTRHLVLLTCDIHGDEADRLSLPLRTPATGVRPRHSALGHSHGGALLLRFLLRLRKPAAHTRASRGNGNCHSG